MHAIRQPAVAGLFYPASANTLREMVVALLHNATSKEPPPKAMIVPHAGYIYSGEIAASAYALLAPVRHQIHRVVLLGPAHRVGFRGLAIPSTQFFATPLGNVTLDLSAIELISHLPQVRVMDQAHALEHSLEVHLPFLQVALANFKLVPIVVGDADATTIARVSEDSACGRNPVAQQRGLQAKTIDLRNSGGTQGARERVVGYGACLPLKN